MEALAPAPSAALPRRLRRALIPATAAAALGLLGWQLAPGLASGAEAPVYATQPLERGDVIAQVTATGTLSPVVEVEVGSQVSGRISELFVDYNDEVEKGQVIATIDPQLFDSAVSQARARLASARADHTRAVAVAENAKAQYDRIADLADTGAIARSEVDASRAETRSARAQVTAAAAAITQAKAALEQAEVNLAYTTIASPIDGVVVSRSVDVGQTVAASLSAPVLFVIAEDLRVMEVHTSVAESDIGQVAAGMDVEFTVDAYPDRTFAGTVKQVRHEAETVSNVVTYDAVVSVDNPDLLLRPGMTANVSFISAAARDVLVVPSKALRYRPASAEAPERGAGPPRGGRGGEGRERSLWVLRDGAPVRVAVELGLSDGSLTEVAGSGLTEGDLVITGDDSGVAPALPSGGGNRGGGRRRPSIL